MPKYSMELHEKQGKAFFSEAKVTLCGAGIQSGKTTVGGLWFRRQASKWRGKDHNFIVGAPTYKILNQSTLPAFLRTMHGTGEYKKGDQEFHLKTGGTVFLRTSTDPFSVEGIPNVRAAWLDEAGKCKYMFWVNIEGRCARTNAPIMCTTTPYARNWPYTEIIRKTERQERDDCAVYQWRSIDNPTFSKEYYDRQKKILDPIRFAMKYEGLHAQRYGLVFPLDEGQVIQPYNVDSGTLYYGGIDWGFSDPFVVVVRGITPLGKDVQVKEFYKPGIFPDEIPGIVRQIQDTYNVRLFLADPSDPGKIAMLQKYGLRVQAADNDIRKGLDAHNKAIRSGKYQIFNTCKATLDEYETYHWPDEDDDEGLDAEDKPVDENNHCFAPDTLIYTTEGYRKIEDLVGYSGFLYSRDGIQRFFDVRQTRKNAEMLNIEFNNGKTLSVTPDHLLLHPSGVWIAACLLRSGDRIQSDTYGNKSSFRDAAIVCLKSVYQVSRGAILQGLSYAKEASLYASGGLGTLSWANPQGFSYSPYRWKPEQQFHRKPRDDSQDKASFRAHDGRASRIRKKKYPQGRGFRQAMAWVKRGEKVALVTWQEIDGTEGSNFKELCALSPRLLYDFLLKKGKILWSKLQNESTAATISRITRGYSEVTYNLEVENTHCLSVAGVIAHNSMDANRYVSLYLDSLGIYDNLQRRIIDSENKTETKLEFTYIPPWQRKRAYDKKYDEL